MANLKIFNSRQPEELNLIYPTGFRFSVNKLPNVNFHGQSVNLPGLTATTASQDTPLNNISHPGTGISFEELTFSFLVDEKLANWKEVYNWMIGLYEPYNTDLYAELKGTETDSIKFSGGLYSDASLAMLSNNKNFNLEVVFRDIYPVSLSGIDFDSTSSTETPITAKAAFKYLYYTVK